MRSCKSIVASVVHVRRLHKNFLFCCVVPQSEVLSKCRWEKALTIFVLTFNLRQTPYTAPNRTAPCCCRINFPVRALCALPFIGLGDSAKRRLNLVSADCGLWLVSQCHSTQRDSGSHTNLTHTPRRPARTPTCCAAEENNKFAPRHSCTSVSRVSFLFGLMRSRLISRPKDSGLGTRDTRVGSVSRSASINIISLVGLGH